jgi:hypothetical protein
LEGRAQRHPASKIEIDADPELPRQAAQRPSKLEKSLAICGLVATLDQQTVHSATSIIR